MNCGQLWTVDSVRFVGGFCDVKQLIEDIALFTQNRHLMASLKYSSRGKK